MLNSAIAPAKEYLMGKVCKVLTSSGTAANNESTFQLLLTNALKEFVPVTPAFVATDTAQARSQVRKRGGSGGKKSGPKVGVGHQKGEGAGG